MQVRETLEAIAKGRGLKVCLFLSGPQSAYIPNLRLDWFSHWTTLIHSRAVATSCGHVSQVRFLDANRFVPVLTFAEDSLVDRVKLIF